MGLLSTVLGAFAPRYRTLSDWAARYSVEQAALPLKAKTIAARELEIARILKMLGPETRIGAVRPSHIAQAQRSLYAHSPCMAAHWLVEVRRYFDAAVVEGWIDSNPASPVRALPAPVSRARLSLDEWQAVYEYARHHQVAWVQHMLVLALVSGQRRADLQKMRFADVRDQHLFVIQQKTGARIALPLALRLDAIDVSLGEAIEACRDYAPFGETLLRQCNGGSLQCGASLSTVFRDAYRGAHGCWERPGSPPSLHECRSLSERLYRSQGVDTRTLLGHTKQAMTDKYNDDRGLSRGNWRYLTIGA